ncbi:hypothetical protein ABMA28_000955 [Loxostege sticticalis]|uniref:Uncharacterized protein n=1 Tax=Loxostege sticticalis TaxID=481309 RepID=A0ABD0T4G9_LOXSC
MLASKMFAAVIIVACMALCTNAEECIYDDRGLCEEPCPPGTISYTSPCSVEETMSQRTCRHPIAQPMGIICDLSRCDCPEPKVWDELAEKCVLLADCSEKTH